MKKSFVYVLLVVVALWPACRPAPPESPAPIVATVTARPDPAATPGTGASTALPATAAVQPTTAAGATPILDVVPADRRVYADALSTAGRVALAELSGAPVYHLDFTIDESMSVLSGRQTVTYTNLEDVALAEVYFHLHANTLNGAITVSDVTAGGVPVAVSATDGDMLRIPLPAPLAPGDAVAIDMNFTTKVPTEIGRNYGVLAYYDDILALAHFYPMLSVYDDEGWNTVAPDIKGDLTYSDAAFYTVRVTAPAAVTLVGSGSVIEQEQAGGTQTVTYAIGPARDFFLAAGDFSVVSQTVGETTINSYAPAELADGAAAALEVAVVALASFSERIAPYPYAELDIVTTPTTALGIEYPGVIVGTLNMYDVAAESPGGLPYAAILESTTAHEVAHQWFYNLIGNDQLDEPWLDESVGSYTTYRYYVDRYGQAVGDNYFATFLGRWERVDRQAIPIGLPVADYEDAEYSAIVYGRGPVFVRALEVEMGREVFDSFLRDYAQRFAWEEATTAGFRALAESHCGCDLGPLFEEWVYE